MAFQAPRGHAQQITCRCGRAQEHRRPTRPLPVQSGHDRSLQPTSGSDAAHDLVEARQAQPTLGNQAEVPMARHSSKVARASP